MTTAIVQARMGSTRLPGKIMEIISGKPLLEHILDRVRRANLVERIIVATTISSSDDILEEWCKQSGILIFRGSETDVLGRYYHAAKQYGAGQILRITADDPFKDPVVIDQVIELAQRENLDFAYNNNPPSFPEGLDTEVFSFSALERAFHHATDPFEREHVTQHFYRNPTTFRQKNLRYEIDLSYLRWTIDTREDLEMARTIYSHLYKPGEIFLLEDILKLLAKHPEISNINSSVTRSSMYKKI